MHKLISVVVILIVVGCNKSQPAGKRVYLAGKNVSFILTDSTLKHSKPRMCGMGPDCPGCGYYEFCGFYSSKDSLFRISARAFTASEPSPPALSPWRVDINKETEILTGRYAGSELKSRATITSDSITHTVEADAHIIWRGRNFYVASIRKYGPQREFELGILVPDKAGIIQAVVVTRASLSIKESYLNGPAKPYPGDIDKY